VIEYVITASIHHVSKLNKLISAICDYSFHSLYE